MLGVLGWCSMLQLSLCDSTEVNGVEGSQGIFDVIKLIQQNNSFPQQG